MVWSLGLHNRYPSMEPTIPLETSIAGKDSQFTQSPPEITGMMGGENNSDNVVTEMPQTEAVVDPVHDEELEAPPKKRAKVSQNKGKSNRKPAFTSNTSTDAAAANSKEGNKRGPNWKDDWIVSLIHLRGTMHDKFIGTKKQGVDNWGVLHNRLVADCPDFDRSSDACRKKWKKIYDNYKAAYTANSVSGNHKSSNCKWYALIDGYMHDRGNALKPVHASTHGEDPNSVEQEGENTFNDSLRVLTPTPSSSQIRVGKKPNKMAVEEAIVQMAERTKELTAVIMKSEAAKVTILQGMLSVMNELVKKF